MAKKFKVVQVEVLELGHCGLRLRKPGVKFGYKLYEGHKMPKWVKPLDAKEAAASAAEGEDTSSDAIAETSVVAGRPTASPKAAGKKAGKAAGKK